METGGTGNSYSVFKNRRKKGKEKEKEKGKGGEWWILLNMGTSAKNVPDGRHKKEHWDHGIPVFYGIHQ